MFWSAAGRGVHSADHGIAHGTVRSAVRSAHSENLWFSSSRASPYENRHEQIRLQAADLFLTVFALLIACADILA